MSSISVQNFSSIDDDHKELSLTKETNFKTKDEMLDSWVSLNPNGLKLFSHINSSMIYKIFKVVDPKKFKQRRYDQKTKSSTESSKAHNFHKTYPLLLKF
jgi:hypothetical protein